MWKAFLKLKQFSVERSSILFSSSNACTLVRTNQMPWLPMMHSFTEGAYFPRTANLYCELGWVSLFERWNFHKCLTVFKCLNGIYPSYLRRLFSYNSDVHHYNTRNRANLHMVKITSKSGYRSFAYSAAKLFNNLDYATKRSLTLKEFVNNYWSK